MQHIATMLTVLICCVSLSVPVQEDVNEIELLAKLVYAEAGNQDEIGKRLVVDVVLNRVKDERFPDTITEVIYHKNQFTPVSDGRLATAPVTEECLNAVYAELDDELDPRIIYFTAGRYSNYGTPAYRHQDHYFSTN